MKNALSIILFVFASNAVASTITFETIDASDFGRYGTGIIDDAGYCCESDGNLGTGFTQIDTSGNVAIDVWTVKYRNWITFDLSAFADENILSASLEIFNHEDNDDSVTFTWRDVTTADPITGVPTIASPIPESAIYFDLGNGAIFSSGTAVGDGTTDIYDFSGALGAINSATNMWSIGGSSLNDQLNAYDFANGTVQLTLGVETITAIPAPAAVWLFGSGLLALFGFAKRKKG